MYRVLPVPLAEFLKLYLSVHFFLILVGPVVNSVAHSTLQFYKIVLAFHIFYSIEPAVGYRTCRCAP